MHLKVPSLESWLVHPPAAMPASPARTESPQSKSPQTIALDRFDSDSDRDWCELVRDIVALANSGGGVVTIDCPANERPSDPNCPRTIDLAASDILHRLARFTDGKFADVEVRAIERKTLEIKIGNASVPIGFVAAGTYVDPARPGETRVVFAPGTFYFRHGAASEPGDSSDLRATFERNVRKVRRRWLRSIRHAMSLPGERARGRRARSASSKAAAPVPQPVRIVNDPSAPALQPQDVDRLYPFRQKDLVRELNARLGGRMLNSYDVQAVRRQYKLDDRPDFVFHLEGAGRRYSQSVIDWILGQLVRNPDFFAQARAADHEMLRLRRVHSR